MRLVKVALPWREGAYIQNCVVKVSLLHLSVKSSVGVRSSPPQEPLLLYQRVGLCVGVAALFEMSSRV